MKKFVKIAAIVVAVVLVIALVAPMVLRGKIAEIVKREANAMLDARLDFEKLDISLLRHFPRASLDLKGLTLVGEEPFAGDTIVAAQRISVVVNVMSLFGDEGFEVTKIILSEPALHAHKLADGRAKRKAPPMRNLRRSAFRSATSGSATRRSVTRTIRRACASRPHLCRSVCGAICRPARPPSTCG